MSSPRRARSLFLSPDKAELLAAKEINNLVNRVEVIPRKPVPRQGRPTNTRVQTSSGDENRISTTSTISTVDAFCREYRPPSVALHRLSYLNKDLPPPPPPPSETPKQTLSEDSVASRRSTQKDAAVQTAITIQSRYSTRIKPSTRSRLSTISSQQRGSENRKSIRSHFPTQDYPIDRDALRFEPRTRVATDRRGPSVVGKPGTDETRRQRSDSINLKIVPHHDDISTAVNHGIQDSKRREPEADPQASQEVQDPLTSTESKEITPRSMPKPKISVGWTFSDGFLLKTQDELTSTTGSGIRLREKSLALEPVTTPMIPIRWTFHDGIIYKTTEALKNEDGMSAARSKRTLPIGWSFYDGLTVRADGSVTNISKATDENKTLINNKSKPKHPIPISWTLHDGLTLRPNDSINAAPTATEY